MISFEHYRNEIKQIQIIQKKLTLKLETAQSFDIPDTIKEAVDNLDCLNNFTTTLAKTLSADKIEHELLTKLNHELRTPLVPIRAYTDMLLLEKFGKLS